MFNDFVNAIKTATVKGDEVDIALHTKDVGSIYVRLHINRFEENDGLIMMSIGKSTIAIDTKHDMVEYNESKNEYMIISDHSVLTFAF